ncbi:hypothetical protein [Nitratiruptor sp. YY09-18]|uniref:hypothetical protein n=1 Tax=Nitratiruptor sp. YY09-18 TaxID=2724901 RepID=UPI0019389B41|nr:hypothetical protein [Nitratiruptor sp. YY09-18]BCD67575.1 hypothetical protein NitYY0918_C0474 [Nitratiruptor sp. YY09-18]
MQPTPLPEVDVAVVALSSPLQVGVYHNDKLVEVIESDQKSSEALAPIFKKIMQNYKIKRIFFPRGPGSFMAIKLVYIFLKTLQITTGVELYGCNAFAFNNNRPIKAVGNLYFVKENGKIVTKKMDKAQEGSFELPKNLSDLECSKHEIEPLYVLPALKV